MLALDGLPIFAPWFAAVALGSAVVVAWRWPARASGRRAAAAALLGLALFASAELVVARRAGAAVPGASLAVPSMSSPLAADAFAATDEAVVHYRVGLDGLPHEQARLPQASGAAVDAARQALTLPLSRFRLPVASAEPGRVVFSDAQFLALPAARDPFRCVADVDEGQVQAVRVVQAVRGPQLALWALVLVAVLALGLRPPRATGG
jgi:hypothetical protein